MSNQLKFTLYLHSVSQNKWKEVCIAVCSRYSATLFEAYKTEPLYIHSPGDIRWNIIYSTLQNDPDGFSLTTVLDPKYPLAPSFLNLINDVIHQLPVESVCIKYGIDLEEDSGLSRTQLKNFDFQSYAGIGLLPVASSWYRAYLQCLKSNLYQQQAGEISLFISPVLCSVLGIETQADTEAQEIFIPWIPPDSETIRQLWFRNLGDKNSENLYKPDQENPVWKTDQHTNPGVHLVRKIQETLLPTGWDIKIMPKPVAINVLPFRLYPEKTLAVLGPKLFEEFINMIEPLLSIAYNEIRTDTFQELELIVFGMICFVRKTDMAELLISSYNNTWEIYLVKKHIKDNDTDGEEQEIINRLKSIL